ncbi:MAG: ribonuclease HII [Candidatus Micrarchaeota archaeon]
MFSYISGIDEAGRGSVIGPLVICIALCKREHEKLLKKTATKDSKALTPKQRETVYEELKKFCLFKWIEVSATDLDKLMKTMSLNDIEAQVMADLIKKAEDGDVMIDMPDRYSWTFRKRMEKFGIKKFEAEHKADEKYPIVAAASICAKVIRDKKIVDIAHITGEFGSGYPSDQRTIGALKNKEKRKLLDPFTRKRWKTMERIKQTKLFNDEPE